MFLQWDISIPCKIMSYVVCTLHYNEFTLGPTTHATLVMTMLNFMDGILKLSVNSRKVNIGTLFGHIGDDVLENMSKKVHWASTTHGPE